MEIKDGLYKVNLKSRPYFSFLVVKHYGGVQKHRFQCTKNDCRDQIKEWDDEYMKAHPEDHNFVPGLKGLNKKKKKKVIDGYRRTFEVVDKKNRVFYKGLAREVALKFNCTENTVTYAAKRASVFQDKYAVRVVV